MVVNTIVNNMIEMKSDIKKNAAIWKIWKCFARYIRSDVIFNKWADRLTFSVKGAIALEFPLLF